MNLLNIKSINQSIDDAIEYGDSDNEELKKFKLDHEKLLTILKIIFPNFSDKIISFDSASNVMDFWYVFENDEEFKNHFNSNLLAFSSYYLNKINKITQINADIENVLETKKTCYHLLALKNFYFNLVVAFDIKGHIQFKLLNDEIVKSYAQNSEIYLEKKRISSTIKEEKIAPQKGKIKI
jgi:hypothetical protein